MTDGGSSVPLVLLSPHNPFFGKQSHVSVGQFLSRPAYQSLAWQILFKKFLAVSSVLAQVSRAASGTTV